mgnify:CR=1 FL=1|jgi:filamentous hemagglutinin family protein
MKRAMRRRKTWQRQAAAITAAMMAMSVGGIAYAMPQGEVIRSGKGEITRQDKDMTVNQDSKRLAIDWSGFDIANDERVTFRQPDKDSVALNRVVGDAASVIDGTLSGNGHVYVINPNGVLFGKNASVDVGSLVASTARISDRDMTNFANADGITMAIPEDSSAKVINAGTIRAEGGLVVLHAAEVENSGTITNPEGTTALAAARNLSLSADTAGKINFTVDGALAKAKALNSGVLKADGGYLVMTARSAGDVMSTVVNNTGTMEAKTLRQNEKGEILLDGGDNGIVELNGTLDASGMEAGQSAGSIKAIGAETHVEDGATLHAIGAVDGGLIETSGDYLEIGDNVDIDAAGKTGKAGEWLLDPLDVVISDHDASTTGSTSSDGTHTTHTYDEVQTADANKTSWINSTTVNDLLSSGTSVKIQSVDKNKAATITVDSEIEKSDAANKDTTFTLEAQSNVTVNKSIKSTAGKLNVVLNSDIDGNGVGAVLINADIDTNGGSFTSGSGGNVELTVNTDSDGNVISSSVNGEADPTKGTVGTYFGNGGSTNGRTINTNGGEVNLYGDVAIGLNGGNLTLDTNGGSVNVTGSIDSGNAYTIYSMDDTAMWDGIVSRAKDLTSSTWDSDLEKYYNKLSDERKLSFTGRAAFPGLWKDKRYVKLDVTQKNILARYYVANTWEVAQKLAADRSKGDGSQFNDTYLATITTALENSLVSQGKENPLFIGAKGSGVLVPRDSNGRDKPADPTHPDGYYWVTGPEGLANDGNGTKFAEKDGSATNNSFVKWNSSKSTTSDKVEQEPNNSGPYITVGYGTASNWDDVNQMASTTRGFVQEKNLVHSGLVINSNGGNVDLKGNVGHSVALSDLDITNAGTVNIGGGTNQSGATLSGIVHVDNGVDIAGNGVDIDGNGVAVGDRITTDNGRVNVTSEGNILVHGITAADKIKLVSKGASGKITIDKYGTTNNGTLITRSTANDAVIIDARGANGSFKNLTTAEKAIDTDGNWKVYSASPDRDTFSTNLNSGTNAQWGATSATYSASENDGNKYIFQVQPKLTVTAEDKEKTYGVELSDSDLTVTKTATFKGQNGEDIDVHNYSQAFQEGDVMDHYTDTINVESAGAAAAATRTGGARAAEDDNNAIYDIVVSGNLTSKDGYGEANYVNGNLEIKRRTVTLNGRATQTYGDSTLNNETVYAENGTRDTGLYGTDTLDTGSVEYATSKTGEYAKSQGNRETANAGTYADGLEFRNVHVVNGTTDMDANYTFIGNGDITVDKHTITRNELGLAGSPLYTTVYGTRKPLGTATFHGANGDGSYELEITGTNALTGNESGKVTNDVGSNYYTTVKLSDALSKNYKFDNGETSKDFENTASVTPKKLTIESKDINATYGEVEAVQKGLENAAKITGLTNGDGADMMIVDGTSEALFTTEKGETRTKDVKKNGEDGYDIKASIPKNLANIINKDNKNYEITENLGKVLLQKRTARLSTDDIHTTYGDGDTIYKKLAENNLLHLDNLASWDTESDILKQIKAETTVEGNVSAFKLNADGTIATDADGHRYTNDVRAYSITTSWFNSSKNYNIQRVRNKNKNWGNIYVDPAKLVINVGNAETVYGTKFDTSQYDYAYSINKGESLVNGDTKDSLAATLRKAGLEKIGYDNDAALDGTTTGRWTKDVGDNYPLTFTDETKDAFNALNNYNVWFVDGKAKVTPYTLTEENIVNPDGKPLYTTKYGQKDPFGKATFTGVNGDGTLLLDITDSSALTGATDGRITKDAGDNIYDTTVSLKNLQNKNYQFARGATSKTFANTASVTPAGLTITTENVETEYGTVETTTSEVEGLTNGDLPTGFIYDYGDYGGAYLDGNTKTNNVNTYHFGTEIKTMGKDGLVTPEFLKNYTITGGEADVRIDPKDVTFFVTGTGNSLADVTYTVTPDIDAQLAYGEHVDVDYTPDNAVGENQYGVVANINGTPIISGNVAGNYQYNYEGLITITPPDPTVPTKPDINPHNPSNVNGSGSWTSNMGNRGIPGVERVAGLASAELPFFKVEAGQVSHYGTYDVAADPDRVRLEPTGKRLPEPNQPKTQYREYTKALTTTDGTGMFRMVYDGSTFNITPVDDGALALMRMGDVKNNVELSAEALHAGFSEMGILLEDLDGVYVHFDTMA